MKRKPHSTSLVLLLVCIFTFWWGISVLSQHDLRGSLVITDQTPAANTAAPLLVNEFVTNGVYTYSGIYMPRSGCDSFGSGIRYSAQDGGHVSILLLTSQNPVACAQASGGVTGQPFTVSIKLNVKSAPQFDGVLLNGTGIPAQLVTSN